MAYDFNPFRQCLGWLLLLLGQCSGVAAADSPGTLGAAQLTISCRVTWNSQSAWAKDYTQSDPPYSMSMSADESIQLRSDLVFQLVDGSWEIMDEKTVASASGAGEYRISGKDPMQKNVSVVLRDPAAQSGYVSLRALDFGQGIATVRFGKPETTASPECLECGFVAVAALMDCLSSISTNVNDSPPQECTVTFSPGMAAFSATGSTNWSRSGACGMDSVAATCTLSYTPGLWEAVILPPEDFEKWLPAASQDPDKPGNALVANVQLRHRGETRPATDMTGTFYVTLEDVSKQPGYCVNAPAKDEASKDPDLKLREGDNLWLSDDQTGQSEEDTNELSVTINSHDFGAYGRLRVKVVVNDGSVVKAHLDGDPGRDYLDLPLDDNQNHIADSWEREKGVEELPATWDEANQPAGQYTSGDGISLYEKYRGLVVQGIHQRLEPWKKHLFIHDPTGWAQMTLSEPGGVNFATALDCEVLFVGDDHWTGPGSSGAKKRIVNFNSTEDVHAVDQHALHLRFPFVNEPTLPEDYQAMYKAKHGTNNTESLEGTFGCKYPDYGSAGKRSPVGALVIETYANNIEKYTRQVVQYHTWGAPEFAKYWDPATTDVLRAMMRTRCADLAEAYIRDHRDDFERRNWLHFTTTLTHEVGHGVAVKDLKKPRNVGPVECVMRYFSTKDFSPNVNDRFEFASRSPWPSIYCRSAVGTVEGISCWKQIEITDRVGASGAISFTRDTLGANPGIRRMKGPAPAGTGTSPTLVEELPVLQLSCRLLWEEALAGDPLRVEVTLSSAAYQQAMHKAALTGAAVPPGLLYPTVATNWHEGLDLTLWYRDQGGWKEVLARDAWKPHLRPQLFSPSAFGRKPVAVAREWVASASGLKLIPGEYSLSVLWDGDGLVEAQALGNDSYVDARTVDFTVHAVTNEIQRGVQGHRLAYHAFAVGDMDQAWKFAVAALAIPGAREVLVAEGTPVLAANAAVELGRYREAAALLQSTEPWQQGEPGLIAQEFRQVLSPEITLLPLSIPGEPPRIVMNVLPGQVYDVQSSSDLVTWVTIDHRQTDTNRYEVTDLDADPGISRFYRAVWLP
ncbi:MAG: hypothetical protein IT581_07195 [Verrucomicrobiales bacterium]|nr:hypothetical protein [Verrucomicrobiales bacterium]